MSNQNNIGMRGFGFLKLLLVFPFALVLVYFAVLTGLKYAWFGVTETVAKSILSEDARYQGTADAAWKTSSVNWEAARTSTVIWQYYLVENPENSRFLPIAKEFEPSGLVLDQEYPYKGLGDCQRLADTVMPLIESSFSGGIQDRKDFWGTKPTSDLVHRDAFVVFRAVHPQIRDGRLTVFRVHFSQTGPSDSWEYWGVEYVRSLESVAPEGYKKPFYCFADQWVPQINRSGELVKSAP